MDILSGPGSIPQYDSHAVPDQPEGDPRGDDACSECDEGTLRDLAHRNPAADQVECDVCGFRS